MSEELDRSVLDTKDREQLHAIAGAMGVRAATRMKKADLIDAILGAANGGSAEAPAEGKADDGRAEACPLQAPASEADDPMSELAAEEDAIAAAGSGDEPEVAPGPAAARASNGDAEAAADDRQRVERQRVERLGAHRDQGRRRGRPPVLRRGQPPPAPPAGP